MEKEVKRALKIMRKANTKESKVDLELKHMQQVATAALTKKQDKKKEDHSEDDVLYGLGEPIMLSSFEELQKQARRNYNLAHDIARIQSSNSHLGIPRKIFVELLDEIKIEQAEKRQKKREEKRLEQIIVEEKKKREVQIASTIAFLRNKRIVGVAPTDELAISSSIKTVLLAKLANNRRGLVNSNNTAETMAPIEGESDAIASDISIGMKDVVGRLRPKTAGLIREAADTSEKTPLPSELAAFEFNSSTESSTTLLGAVMGLTGSVNASHLVGVAGIPKQAQLSKSKPSRPSSAPAVRKGRTSAWGAATVLDTDNKLLKVLDLRKRIEDEKEAEIKRKVNDKAQRNEKGNTLKERKLRQQAFLVAIKIFNWVRLFRNNDRLNSMRADSHKNMLIGKLASRTFAGIKLGRWWKRMKVRKLLLANPKVMFTLSYCIRYLWAKLQLRKRRGGAKLLIKFLKDAYDKAFLMKRIYGFRRSCVRIQRWVRDYIRIQQARLQLLWLAMERIERRREEELREANAKSMKLSVKALAKIEGFASTVHQINSVQKRLNKILEDEEKAMKKLIREQQLSALEEESSFRFNSSSQFGDGYEMSLSQIISPTSNTGGGASNYPGLVDKAPSADKTVSVKISRGKRDRDAAGAEDAAVTWKYVTKSAFIKKMQASRSNQHKLQILYNVLRAQRLRHILKVDEAKLRDKKCGTTVNKVGLRRFLRNPHNNVDGIDLVFNGLPTGEVSKSNRFVSTSPSLFLLLTEGALDRLEAIPSSTFSPEKDKDKDKDRERAY